MGSASHDGENSRPAPARNTRPVVADPLDERELDSGRAWGEIYAELATAAELGPLDVNDLERLAVAASFVGRDDESTAAWEQAFQVWTRLGEHDRAGRATFWLGFSFMMLGDEARANGWFARGRRVVDEIGPECAAQGYLLVPLAMEALAEGDVAACGLLYEQVSSVAERCGDADLMALGLLGRGEAAIARGDTKAGLAFFDEAMVGATTGEVSPHMTGILYCAVVDACVQVFDLRRAAEWTEAMSQWCDGQRDLVPFRAQCLVHRSQVLQAHGSWSEALTEAAHALERLAPTLHPSLGGAYYQHGELRRLRGEFGEAEAAYLNAGEHGRTPTPGLALLRLAEGQVRAADIAVRRMLDESRDQASRLAVLPAYVTITLAAGDVEAAAAAGDELAEFAEQLRIPFVSALADHARGSVLLAQGRFADALTRLRQACVHWRRLDIPYEGARSQVLVGIACRSLGDEDAAAIELRAASATFERLGARADIARITRMSSPTAVPDHDLTARECEVLRLVAGGSTNREVAVALVISEHTVARHLQNIFAKLGVSSRAAATAYAYEHGVV
jgi:ATP/maltotriose-dependent transcriptional regulator MalT